MPEWSNWSGSVTGAPVRYLSPSSEGELQALVREAGQAGLRVRAHGTGHSFTPIAVGDDVLVSLEQWTGLETVDRERGRATVRAGTTLHELGALLLGHGLAMENLGDVDVQTLAGAVSTGTHGTGPTFGNISSQVTALRLVTADGALLECSAEQDEETYLAARVSLGMLGMISAITLRLLPAFRLHERVWRAPIDETMDKLDQHIDMNEHFEFFWYPSLDAAECKTLNTAVGGPEDIGKLEPVTVLASRTTGMAALAENLGDLPGERVGWSAGIIPSVRTRKFNEMEYALPAGEGPACFQRVR
ncbi:MAG: FAD-binding oxidoreductase, partial [Chloroflexi bacterium]